MNILTGDLLFYCFGVLAIVTSLLVVFMRNPVSSAMMMAVSFGATAAIMIGLGAHFIGILQILVYAGAIMVLFTFIIMLLNVKKEKSPFKRPFSVALGIIIASLFLGQLIAIVYTLPGAKECDACPLAYAEEAIEELEIGDEKNSGVPAEVLKQMKEGEQIAAALSVKPGLKMRIPELLPALSAEKFPADGTIRKELNNGEFPDTALLGQTLYSKYNRTLIIAGLALLVATIGVVVLSRKPARK